MNPLLENISHIRGFQPLSYALNQPQVGEVVASMLGGAAIAQVVAERIHRSTKGLPGLVENQVRVCGFWVFATAKSSLGVVGQVTSESGHTNIKLLKDATNIVDISQVTNADLGESDDLSIFAELRLEGLSKASKEVLPYIAITGNGRPFFSSNNCSPRGRAPDAINELLEHQSFKRTASVKITCCRLRTEKSSLTTSTAIKTHPPLHRRGAQTHRSRIW